VLRQVLQGGRRVFVHADTFVELSPRSTSPRSSASTGAGRRPRSGEGAAALVQQKAGIVLDTLSPDAPEAQLRLPTPARRSRCAVLLRRSPDQLRLSAALAVRAGLDRKTALQALTRMPAVLLDQQTAVGSLRQGNAADFLVFTGDPLDLDAASRHLDRRRASSATRRAPCVQPSSVRTRLPPPRLPEAADELPLPRPPCCRSLCARAVPLARRSPRRRKRPPPTAARASCRRRPPDRTTACWSSLAARSSRRRQRDADSRWRGRRRLQRPDDHAWPHRRFVPRRRRRQRPERAEQ
jgi:hypothetical protein